jgi:hypothetical protein
MGIGSFAMACVLLAVSAGEPQQEWHMNQTQFKIPIRIKPETHNDISELRLFCSQDEGKTWHQVGVAKPTQDGFLFTAKGDGKYWFSVAVVNQKNIQDPLDPMAAPVGQKIIVDTTKPEVRVGAERQNDEITAFWEISELYPRPETLRVEYRAADAAADGLWSNVPVVGGQSRVTFKANNTAGVVVRVQMEDQAGNLGSGQANVAGAAPVTPLVQPPPPAPPPSAPVLPQPVLTNPTPLPTNPASNWNNTMQTGTQPVGRAPEVTPVSGLQTSTSQSIGSPSGGSFTPGSPLAMRGTLPALQLINKGQVKLEYAVSKLGASGVGSVDVYMTTNEGQTWEPCRIEAAPDLPVTGAGGTLKGGVIVQLPKDDVIYGFAMVVRSGAGLGKPPPKSGDLPQIRLERDTTPPSARWLEPIADPVHRDTLLLAWEAADKNIAVNPITLEWSATKDGPWTPIGAPELPNTGRFTWAVPVMPTPRVYLRLTVRDTAGNTTVVLTDEPKLIDLSVPEVTITGVGNSIR